MVLARLRRCYGSGNIRMRSVDPPDASKSIGVNTDSKAVSHICVVKSPGSTPYKAEIYALPFGGRRAPSNWGSVAAFSQFLPHELLWLPACALADDVFCAEPPRCVASGLWAPEQLAIILGFSTTNRKDQPPTTTMVLLGAEVSLGNSFVREGDRMCRIARLRCHISQAIETNFLTPSSDSKLRGGPGF